MDILFTILRILLVQHWFKVQLGTFHMAMVRRQLEMSILYASL